MTQTEQVLQLLRDHPDGITALDSLREVQTMRLAAVVFRLKQQGHDISTTIEATQSGKRIGRYRLHTPRMRYVACPRCGGHLLPTVGSGRTCEVCSHRVQP